MTKNKTYSGLIKLTSFDDRYNYLRTDSTVGSDTFGSRRYLNQAFYSSNEWRTIRNKVIARDGGFDMGLIDYPISGQIIIHHIVPITIDDLVNHDDRVFDMENLISVSSDTHLAIHYGLNRSLERDPIVRFKNDTCPWRK